MYYYITCPSPVGLLTIAGNETHLSGLWIQGQKYFGDSLPEPMTQAVSSALPQSLTAASDWLNRYFSGEKPLPCELPLAPVGSEFRQCVWKILCEIPYGEVTTYGQIAREAARRLGRPSMSGQAVGNAVGHNPISIIIPCHRVVGANGSLTGYAGGISKKIQLLTHEGVDLSHFFVPKSGTAVVCE